MPGTREQSTPPAEWFRREHRLRRATEFRSVMGRGARGTGPLLVAFFAPGTGGPARLGVVASRRVGSAVERSRAKRRLREVWRRTARRPAGDLVLVARQGLAGAAWPEVERSYAVAVGRALERSRRGGRQRREPGSADRSRRRRESARPEAAVPGGTGSA